MSKKTTFDFFSRDRGGGGGGDGGGGGGGTQGRCGSRGGCGGVGRAGGGSMDGWVASLWSASSGWGAVQMYLLQYIWYPFQPLSNSINPKHLYKLYAFFLILKINQLPDECTQSFMATGTRTKIIMILKWYLFFVQKESYKIFSFFNLIKNNTLISINIIKIKACFIVFLVL